jgi:hypothetical protein
MSRRLYYIRWCGVLAAMSLTCCTGADDKPEMLPVERVVDYSETARHEPVILATGAVYGHPSQAITCHRYRQQIQTYNTATAVAAGVSTVGLLVGLISDSETVKEAAGVAAVGGTIAQATSSSAAHNVAQRAREAGCQVR